MRGKCSRNADFYDNLFYINQRRDRLLPCGIFIILNTLTKTKKKFKKLRVHNNIVYIVPSSRDTRSFAKTRNQLYGKNNIT